MCLKTFLEESGRLALGVDELSENPDAKIKLKKNDINDRNHHK